MGLLNFEMGWLSSNLEFQNANRPCWGSSGPCANPQGLFDMVNLLSSGIFKVNIIINRHVRRLGNEKEKKSIYQ